MHGIVKTCRVSSYLILIRFSSSTPASHSVADIWKKKGGMEAESGDGGDRSSQWMKHDFRLHNFLKENIPEALAHTGDSLHEHITVLSSSLFISKTCIESSHVTVTLGS